MIIAIDYDNTYTVDMKMWDKAIALFQGAGHTVICITNRDELWGDDVRESIGKLVPIIFAGAKGKREAAERCAYKVDVFIDDMPEMIGSHILIGGP